MVRTVVERKPHDDHWSQGLLLQLLTSSPDIPQSKLREVRFSFVAGSLDLARPTWGRYRRVSAVPSYVSTGPFRPLSGWPTEYTDINITQQNALQWFNFSLPRHTDGAASYFSRPAATPISATKPCAAA